MRAYSASDEETLRTRELIEDWRSEGLLTAEQYSRMEQETRCDLRRTNIFLRLVLFFFTLIITGAAVGLFFVMIHPPDRAAGVLLMIFAGLCYASAEFAVANYQFYRHGIEEALVACSVGFLCVGIQVAFFKALFSSAGQNGWIVPAAGAVLSLWIWHRFGLPYAPFAAMIFVAWLPGYGTSFPWAQHLILAAFYLAGVAIIAVLRPRHRFTYLDGQYSIAEALLWLGIYLAINLQLSSLDLLDSWWRSVPAASLFPRPFYWTTWVLTWCLPPVMLARGLRMKDRWVIAVGGITAILTFITNKPYLGWQRHTWDPMLLGALLVGIAFVIQRRLGNAPGGIRHGFTAQRLSGKDKRWMNVGITAIGLVSPDIVAPRPQPAGPEPHFGGGDSGGGGATSDF
ncbi:MAG TPA: hypothetical protein VFW44_06880 [Bryobacteraceae bacterium]|nr:hypothetical protein [Bryobacteraceae bacterium]